jgi:hypothetical protein
MLFSYLSGIFMEIRSALGRPSVFELPVANAGDSIPLRAVGSGGGVLGVVPTEEENALHL